MERAYLLTTDEPFSLQQFRLSVPPSPLPRRGERGGARREQTTTHNRHHRPEPRAVRGARGRAPPPHSNIFVNTLPGYIINGKVYMGSAKVFATNAKLGFC